MLSVEQRKTEQLYAFRAGMLNVAWVAGVARYIKGREGYIQQTNNLNQMIPFEMREGELIPSWVRDGCNVKVIARLVGRRVNGEPTVMMRALSFETPSILDMPPREQWERPVRPGVPTDDVRPASFRAEDPRPTMEGRAVADAGNMVKVAGYVANYFLEAPGTPKADGGVTEGCLIVLLRQTKDSDEVIPVRYYGRLCVPYANAIETAAKKSPILRLRAEGKLRVRLKNTGEPADANGVLPVLKMPYIHASLVASATLGPGSDIREEPDWVEDIRRKAAEAASKRAAAQPKAGGAGGTAPPAPPPAPAAAPREVDADLPLDAATLKLLSSDKVP
jgi:hypothetical protein